MSDPVMPGRAVDIIHAACSRHGLRPGLIKVDFGAREPVEAEEISLIVTGGIDEATGRVLFADLGVVEGVTLGSAYGVGPQADLCGVIPALGMRLAIVISDLPAAPAVGALVAGVDAARASEEATRG